jgi:hypothetical protein
MTDKERELAKLAKEAIDIQNACNLSGVVHAFSRAMRKLWDLNIGGTDAVNKHPVSLLYSDKITHLTGNYQGTTEQLISAYDWADEQTKRLEQEN